ncbi:response regulator transcription factor, partial [Gordonibacter sp.]
RGLTPREVEVMQLLCKGRSKSYIAETFMLSENTVRSHSKNLYRKLDVHSVQEMLALITRRWTVPIGTMPQDRKDDGAR